MVTLRGKRHSVEHEIPFTPPPQHFIDEAGNALLCVTEEALHLHESFGELALAFPIGPMQLILGMLMRLASHFFRSGTRQPDLSGSGRPLFQWWTAFP